MLPLGEKTITKAQYGKILSKFYGFFSPLEENLKHISTFDQYLPDFPERRKAHLLLEDLQHLALYDQNIPLCNNLPEVHNLSQAFGCLYVMEGSTLGGQFISRVVKSKLEIPTDKGTTFFGGYGKETGKKWKIFQQALESYAGSLSSSEEAKIIESANETFVKFENWLNKGNS